jgi:DnaJ-class molecular chaperone
MSLHRSDTRLCPSCLGKRDGIGDGTWVPEGQPFKCPVCKGRGVVPR